MYPFPFFIIIGVSGSGKTTIGRLLAQELVCPFFDADDFHPSENVAKMASGIPLDDDDRTPWLNQLHTLISGYHEQDRTAVLACSALKRKYRNHLRGDYKHIQFIYLNGRFDLIWQRLQARPNHFMKPDMLHSQFDTLEIPTNQEALTININAWPQEIVQEILKQIRPIRINRSTGESIRSEHL